MSGISLSCLKPAFHENSISKINIYGTLKLEFLRYKYQLFIAAPNYTGCSEKDIKRINTVHS
jgi:hypothetical protein